MSSIIISPHTDDAVFSMACHIVDMVAEGEEVVVLSPMAGVPSDVIGWDKHMRLRAEHEEAMGFLGVGFINGDFLDDVYPPSDPKEIQKFIEDNCKGFDNIYIPVGIHHPDHVSVSDIARVCNFEGRVFFYEELPYSVMYPALRRDRIKMIMSGVNSIYVSQREHNETKMDAVHKYPSQTNSSNLIECLKEPELIWSPAYV